MLKIKRAISFAICFSVLCGIIFGNSGVINNFVFAQGEYSVGDTFYYGTYPQSKAEESDSLKEAAENAVWKSYDYYSGENEEYEPNTYYKTAQMHSGDWMQFADFFLDGVKYRAVKCSEYRPFMTGTTTNSSNSYIYKNGYLLNQIYYFKYEPIEWRVIDPINGLVVCNSILDSQPFNNYVLLLGNYYYGDEGAASHSSYASNYKNSSIRAWLNKDFYETAFSNNQKNNIAVTENLNNDCFPFDSRFCSESTSDKMFLLSYDDIFNTNYGFDSDESRKLYGTDYAESQGLNAYNDSGDYIGYAGYWLRTANDNSIGINYVFWTGHANRYTVVYTGFGVNPAMKLNIITENTELSEELYSASGEDAPVKHTLRISLNNGDPDTVYELAAGEKITMPEIPEREGFEFAFWEYNQQGKRLCNRSTEGYALEEMPDCNTFIGARWIATDADESDCKAGDYIYFGSYPQSEVTDEGLKTVLNSLTSDGDWLSFGYYTGESQNGYPAYGTMAPSDFMRYADKEYGGEKYRAVVFDFGRPQSTLSAPGTFSPSVSNGGFEPSTVYWFRYEPILWRILDAEKKIIVSDIALDAQAFNNSVYKNSDIENSKLSLFNDAEYNNYASFYSTSSLREWLNSSFFETAFSSVERENILNTDLPENPDYYAARKYGVKPDDYAPLTDSPVTDKVWLLSYGELNDYYKALGSRWYIDYSASASRYAQAQGCYVWDTGRCNWFTRTPSYNSLLAHSVNYGGDTGLNAFGDAYSTNLGIRPAISVSLLKFDEQSVPKEYTLSYISDGVELGSEKYRAGARINTQIHSPQKEGYTFNGWDNLPEIMPDTDVEVNAVWSVNQYSIIFDTDGGTPVSSITQDYGSAVAIPGNPEKEGYTFTRWDKEIPSTMPAENIYVKALYSVNSYDLVLYDSDGSVIERIPYYYGQPLEMPAGASKANHEFMGWIGELPPKMPAFNLSLTALWRISLKSQTDDVTVLCSDDTQFINSDFSVNGDELRLVTEKLTNANDKIPSAFNAREVGGDCYALYKITLTDDIGNVVQPDGAFVTVKLPVPTGMDTDKTIFIMHFKPDGTTERITMADERVWFENGYLCFTTDSFSEFGLYGEGKPNVSIKAFSEYNGKTLDYRTTLTLHAHAPYNPDSSVIWFVNGEKAGSGDSLTLREMRNSEYIIQAKIIENGETAALSQTETVKIKTGFFARVIAFFRALFNRLPEINQL